MKTELWNRIKAFSSDDPPSEYGFSTRLANENFWTKNFTDKAVLEYKKFMYLAATSDAMVAPSPIVDVVWHEHLIFTQSYTALCDVLGKQVQHIPSTHNCNEFEKFSKAKERTSQLYEETFGARPGDIWDYPDMYASLDLPKAKLKLRTFLLLGILAFALLFVPLFNLLYPVYSHIDNPYFLLVLAPAALIIFALLETYNKRYMTKTVQGFKSDSFVLHLRPSELIFLETGKLSNVIHTSVNELVEHGAIEINPNYSMEHSHRLSVNNIEEHLVLDALHSMGQTFYPALLAKLISKPIFTNVANSMIAFKKYYLKSKSFAHLFYLNFFILALLLELGFVRLMTGLLRDKAVSQIALFDIALLIGTGLFLSRVTFLFTKKVIPAHYRMIESNNTAGEEPGAAWKYFFMGHGAMTATFIPLVTYTDERNNTFGDASGSSCGTSCGSSCGSSCSSCGGCGGGD